MAPRTVIALLLVTFGVSVALDADIGASGKAHVKQTDEVAVKSIPHEDFEIDTLIVASGQTGDDANGKKFFELDFDPVAFQPSHAPFGLVDPQGRWECPFNKAMKIKDPLYWPADKDLLVRRVIELPPGVTQLVVKGTVHKAVAIYMNGDPVSGEPDNPFIEPGGLCPSLDNVKVTIPQEYIRTGGNLLAFHVVGGPDLNYFDVEVRSFYPRPTGAIGLTYMWGKGYYGVLGNGYEVDNFQPNMALQPKDMKGRALKKLALGVAHTILLLDDGDVYGWGRNQEGQLGPLEDYTEIPVPLESISSLGKIVDVTAGSLHNIVLDSDGQLFAFGDNGAGQCGIGRTEDDELLTTIIEPTRVDGVNDEIFKFIGAKDRHSVAVTDAGGVYEWGNGITSPKYISAINDVRAVAVGTEHALILDAEGAVYAWGNNTQGQIGLPGEIAKSLPTKLETLEGLNIVHIACGSDNSFAVTDDGMVYVWGGGGFGKNGLGVWAPQIVPIKIKPLQKHVIKRVAAGMTSTLFLTNKGEVFTSGANLKDGSHSAVPVFWASASDKYLADVYASHLHYGALTNPAVWAWAKVGDYYEGTMS